MLVSQTAGVSLSVKQLGLVGGYAGRSNSWGRQAGMLVSQTAWVGMVYRRQVCWSVKQLR